MAEGFCIRKHCGIKLQSHEDKICTVCKGEEAEQERYRKHRLKNPPRKLNLNGSRHGVYLTPEEHKSLSDFVPNDFKYQK